MDGKHKDRWKSFFFSKKSPNLGEFIFVNAHDIFYN